MCKKCKFVFFKLDRNTIKNHIFIVQCSTQNIKSHHEHGQQNQILIR